MERQRNQMWKYHINTLNFFINFFYSHKRKWRLSLIICSKMENGLKLPIQCSSEKFATVRVWRRKEGSVKTETLRMRIWRAESLRHSQPLTSGWSSVCLMTLLLALHLQLCHVWRSVCSINENRNLFFTGSFLESVLLYVIFAISFTAPVSWRKTAF